MKTVMMLIMVVIVMTGAAAQGIFKRFPCKGAEKFSVWGGVFESECKFGVDSELGTCIRLIYNPLEPSYIYTTDSTYMTTEFFYEEDPAKRYIASPLIKMDQVGDMYYFYFKVTDELMCMWYKHKDEYMEIRLFDELRNIKMVPR